MKYNITLDYKIVADSCCDIALELREKLGSVTMPINVNDYQYWDFLQKFENILLNVLGIQIEREVK